MTWKLWLRQYGHLRKNLVFLCQCSCISWNHFRPHLHTRILSVCAAPFAHLRAGSFSTLRPGLVKQAITVGYYLPEAGLFRSVVKKLLQTPGSYNSHPNLHRTWIPTKHGSHWHLRDHLLVNKFRTPARYCQETWGVFAWMEQAICNMAMIRACCLQDSNSPYQVQLAKAKAYNFASDCCPHKSSEALCSTLWVCEFMNLVYCHVQVAGRHVQRKPVLFACPWRPL